LAAGQLLPLVYDELRRLAAQRLAGEAVGHTRTVYPRSDGRFREDELNREYERIERFRQRMRK
jgi:hypothetical protein